MEKFIKPKLVECTWLDPHSPDATAVFNLTELDHVHQPMKIVTVGRLLREDDIGITLACEDVGDNQYRGLTFIIRSLIIDIKVISTTNRKPRKLKEKIDAIQQATEG